MGRTSAKCPRCKESLHQASAVKKHLNGNHCNHWRLVIINKVVPLLNIISQGGDFRAAAGLADELNDCLEGRRSIHDLDETASTASQSETFSPGGALPRAKSNGPGFRKATEEPGRARLGVLGRAAGSHHTPTPIDNQRHPILMNIFEPGSEPSPLENSQGQHQVDAAPGVHQPASIGFAGHHMGYHGSVLGHDDTHERARFDSGGSLGHYSGLQRLYQGQPQVSAATGVYQSRDIGFENHHTGYHGSVLGHSDTHERAGFGSGGSLGHYSGSQRLYQEQQDSAATVVYQALDIGVGNHHRGPQGYQSDVGQIYSTNF